MEEKNVAIQVHGLQKSYKKLQVLKGVAFGVAPGSSFALLGSNGAGKTTIVRILATLLKPDDGTTRVDGFDVLSQPARVRESISLTGQSAAGEESPIGHARIIFPDEPTAGLDPEARIEVWQVIQNLADSGTTVFLTTQYLDEAEKLADRIAVLPELGR